MLYKRHRYISIYLATDGKTSVIIVRVIKRKIEKQKHASFDQSMLLRV